MSANDFIREQRRNVERGLRTLLPSSRGVEDLALYAARYTALSGGHRFRPLLFLAMMESGGERAARWVEAACGLECLHCTTMIVDDLPAVDNAELRRGKASCHVKFGADIAIYASHLLCDLGEIAILRNIPRESDLWMAERLKELKRTLIAGQCLERAVRTGQAEKTLQRLARIYLLKSGAMYGFAAELAARCLGLGATGQRACLVFGEALGVAYQIADDIADMAGDVKRLGKPVNQDLDGQNFARLRGQGYAEAKQSEHFRLAMQALGGLFEARHLKRNRDLLESISRQIVVNENCCERKEAR